MIRLHLATVEALATAIDAKDQTSHCHVQRVQFTRHAWQADSLSDADIKALRAGRCCIMSANSPSRSYPQKPAKLTPAEF